MAQTDFSKLRPVSIARHWLIADQKTRPRLWKPPMWQRKAAGDGRSMLDGTPERYGCMENPAAFSGMTDYQYRPLKVGRVLGIDPPRPPRFGRHLRRSRGCNPGDPSMGATELKPGVPACGNSGRDVQTENCLPWEAGFSPPTKTSATAKTELSTEYEEESMITFFVAFVFELSYFLASSVAEHRFSERRSRVDSWNKKTSAIGHAWGTFTQN